MNGKTIMPGMRSGSEATPARRQSVRAPGNPFAVLPGRTGDLVGRKADRHADRGLRGGYGDVMAQRVSRPVAAKTNLDTDTQSVSTISPRLGCKTTCTYSYLKSSERSANPLGAGFHFAALRQERAL